MHFLEIAILKRFATIQTWLGLCDKLSDISKLTCLFPWNVLDRLNLLALLSSRK